MLATRLVIGITCAALLAGCTVRERVHSKPPVVTVTTSPSPAPTITIRRSTQVLAAGQTAELSAQPGVHLKLRAGRPAVSRTRLSRSYGYAPARGYYVTFAITVTNVGRTPIDIAPTNFRVRIPGEGTVTSYSGNAPYSGASAQLDSTEVDPGQTVRGPLTFDVRRPHGVLSYLPDRSAAVSWTF